MPKAEEILNEIDSLTEEMKSKTPEVDPSPSTRDKVQNTVEQLIEDVRSEEASGIREALSAATRTVGSGLEELKSVVEETRDKEIQFPENQNVTVTEPVTIANLKDIPKTVVPSSIDLKRPTWLDQLTGPLKSTKQILEDVNQSIKDNKLEWPKSAKDPIAVRLSNGKEFYEALTQFFGPTGGGGGGIPTIQSTSNPGIRGVAALNPDGSNISGSSGSGGDASAANQTTQITAEQAIQASVQTMDDWDEADRAKVNVIVGQAGIAAGTGVDGVTVPRVTLATNVALPAGTNAIGKLAPNSGVDIGDVDVTSIAAGNNNIGDVDIASIAAGNNNIGDVDVASIAAGNNNIGDVDIASGTVTTVTTVTNVGAGNAAATIAADGVTPTVPGIAAYEFVKTPGANTWDRAYAIVNANDTVGTGIQAVGMLAQFDDTSPGTVTENRFGNVRMSVRREQYVQIRDAAGNERGINVDANGGIPITIESAQTLGTVTTVSTVTALGAGTTGPMKAEDVAHVSGDQGFPAWSVANEAQTALAADGDYIAHAADTKGNSLVVGNIAHDTADAGNPIKIGGKGVDIGANGTDVTANDRVNAYFTRSGQMLVLGGHQNIVNKHLNQTDADGAQTDLALVTVSAGTAIVVTQISVMAHNANTVNVGVRIGFGTANTPANDANTGVVLSHPGIAAGSGVVLGSGAGIIGMGASNEDLRMTSEDAVTGSIDVLVSYFTILIG